MNTQNELYEVISDFLESCHRTGNHDIDDNIRYFMQENNHMNLDEVEVMTIFKEIDDDY